MNQKLLDAIEFLHSLRDRHVQAVNLLQSRMSVGLLKPEQYIEQVKKIDKNKPIIDDIEEIVAAIITQNPIEIQRVVDKYK